MRLMEPIDYLRIFLPYIEIGYHDFEILLNIEVPQDFRKIREMPNQCTSLT